MRGFQAVSLYLIYADNLGLHLVEVSSFLLGISEQLAFSISLLGCWLGWFIFNQMTDIPCESGVKFVWWSIEGLVRSYTKITIKQGQRSTHSYCGPDLPDLCSKKHHSRHILNEILEITIWPVWYKAVANQNRTQWALSDQLTFFSLFFFITCQNQKAETGCHQRLVATKRE